MDSATQSRLEDLIANEEELNEIAIGTGFAGTTDIETGPDGLLYILTFDQESDGGENLQDFLKMMPRRSHRIHPEFLNRSSRYFVSITKLLLPAYM